MHISERKDGKVTLNFFNYWEQKRVGRVISPYLDLKGRLKLAVNAVIPPSPWHGNNWRLNTEVQPGKLPDILDSIDDRGAALISQVAVGGNDEVVSEGRLMDEASVVLRKFMGQVTRQYLEQ